MSGYGGCFFVYKQVLYVQIKMFYRMMLTFNTPTSMEIFLDLLTQYFGENAIIDIEVAAGTFIVTFLVLWILKCQLVTRLGTYANKTKVKFDDLILGMLQGIGMPFLVIVSLFVSVQHMQLPPILDTVIHAAFLIVLVLESIKVLEKVIVSMLASSLSKGKESKKTSVAITMTVRVLLWLIGLLLILSNLGFNVNSLIASLGIGGIAISLALQNILGDIFSSFSIAIDKPFEEGDFIVAGEHKGTVKHIGLKTTRIQALQGEEIVISNTELTSTRVSNFKKLKERRIVFTVSATYETPVKQLKKIPKIIKEIIEKEKKAKFDRAIFSAMGDFSLDFEVVYLILDNDYAVYMNTQQRINFAILEAFEKEGIGIPYPTQTVHVAKEGAIT